MAFELILLGVLIFIFIVSFCGLLQKIKQTYNRERLLAARIARRRELDRRRRLDDSLDDIFVNPSFNSSNPSDSVFPSAPPPYSLYISEAPPKYEDAVKVHQQTSQSERIREPVPATAPPPYTISLVTETANRA